MTRRWPQRAVLLLGVLAALDLGSSQAQWVQTNGPRGGSISSLLAVPNAGGGTRLYSGGTRVWTTDNAGANWSFLSNGLPDPNAFTLLAVPDGSGGHDILVGTNTGVFRSTDDGASWSPINNGLPAVSINALAAGPNGSGGTNLYAGSGVNGSAFRSTNNGASWTPIQSGLPAGHNLNRLFATPAGTVLAGTSNGIYRSTNFGGSWNQVFPNQYAFSFAQNGSAVYAGTSNGVYRSTNDGATWTAINNGMQFSWVNALAALPNGPGVALFAGVGGVMRSTDNGATWTFSSNGITAIGVYAFATAPDGSGGTYLFAGTPEGVFRTSDNGDHWTNVSFVSSNVEGLGVTPSRTLLAGSRNGGGDIFRSTDGGASWTDTNSGSSAVDFDANLQGANGISQFAVGPLTGVHKSTDDGLTWVDSNNDIGDIEVNSVIVVSNGSGGTNVIAGTYSGIFISTSDGASWLGVEPTFMPLDYVVTPNGDIFGGGFNGVSVSTNHGHSWTFLGLAPGVVQAMAATANGANLFAAGDPFGVYRSTDHGVTWHLVNNGLSDLRIFALVSPDGTHLFAAGLGGVFLSADNGNTWSSVGTGLSDGVISLALSGDGSTLLAGTTSFGVWKRPLSEMIGTTGVGNPDTAPSTAILLHENTPNPFRDGTTIAYALPRAMSARLVVYDVAGHAVRTLVNGAQQAGERRVTWDGRNDNGASVSRGVYLYRLEADGTTLTRKMLLH